jgi:hypothetical protein
MVSRARRSHGGGGSQVPSRRMGMKARPPWST